MQTSDYSIQRTVKSIHRNIRQILFNFWGRTELSDHSDFNQSVDRQTDQGFEGSENLNIQVRKKSIAKTTAALSQKPFQ
jgi:hypothetical protein